MSVTKNEVVTATTTCDWVQQDTSRRMGDIDSNLRGLEDTLSVGNAENRNQMLQLQEEIARIHEPLSSVGADFLDHKRATNSVHNKLQSQVWSLEEGRKRMQPFLQPEASMQASHDPMQLRTSSGEAEPSMPASISAAVPTYATQFTTAPATMPAVAAATSAAGMSAVATPP